MIQILTLLFALTTIGQLSGSSDPMAALKSRIVTATHGLKNVRFKNDINGGVSVTYHTHILRRHSNYMNGKKSQDTYQTVQPLSDGFTIDYFLEDANKTPAGHTFQEVISHGYNQAYYHIPKTGNWIYYRVGWGPKADHKLIDNLLAAAKVIGERIGPPSKWE